MKGNIARVMRQSLGFSMLFSARIRPVNRYRWDYEFEDGFYEKPMTDYEAKKLPIPLPSDLKHKEFPIDLYYPPHWNDVRYNYKPQNFERRQGQVEFEPPTYDFAHDAAHTMGHVDEDFDGEIPDPIGNMHFNRNRSPILGIFFALGTSIMYLCYWSIGLKYPQRENIFYYRKKFANAGAIADEFTAADFASNQDYGSTDLNPKVVRAGRNYHVVGTGLRYRLPTQDDLFC